MKYRPTYFTLFVVSFVSLLLVAAQAARGAYIATLNEVGSDVVGSGSGSLNLTALNFVDSDTFTPGVVQGNQGLLFLGLAPGAASFDSYAGIAGPVSFGSSTVTFADTGAGPFVGVRGSVSEIYVPAGYASNAPLLTTTDTWNNQSFASMGLTPGTYVWNWGTGPTADSFTLQIGPPPNGNGHGVPESGNAVAIMLSAVGTLMAFRAKSQGLRAKK